MADEAVGLRARERDYVRSLERRRDHLEERLERWDPRRDSHRTRAEAAALRWALSLIEACDAADVLPELRRHGHDV